MNGNRNEKFSLFRIWRDIYLLSVLLSSTDETFVPLRKVYPELYQKEFRKLLIRFTAFEWK